MAFIKFFVETIKRNKFLAHLLVFEVAFLFFFFIQSPLTFADPDSFYHAKMVLLMKENGIIKNFPWFQFTVLKDYYIDHHFLYHALLVPFVIILSPLHGLKLATIIFASLLVVVFYWFLNSLKIKSAIFFTFVLMITDPFIFRINLAKAQAVALIIFFLALYLIYRRRYGWVAILGFFYVWSYGGWPLILVLAGLYAASSSFLVAIQKIKFQLKTIFVNIREFLSTIVKEFFSSSNLKLLFSAFSGVVLGLIVNPYFPKNLYFYKQQIFEIAVVNYKDSIVVGSEWYPYGFINLISSASIAILIFVTAVFFFILSIKKQNNLSVTLFFLSFIFLALTLKSKRNVEYLIPIILSFSAISLYLFGKALKLKGFIPEFKKVLLENKLFIIFTLALLLLFSYVIVRDVKGIRDDFHKGLSFTSFEKSMNWLKNNSQDGEIVFHSDWDESPILFYYNSKNYYIVGLDATFMYKYNQDLYWQWERVTTGKESKNLQSIIKNNFNASYIFISFKRHKNMYKIISDNSEYFERVYQDEEAVIYRVL